MIKQSKLRKAMVLMVSVSVLTGMLLSGCRKNTANEENQSQTNNNTASSGTSKPIDNGGKNPIVTIEMEDGSKIKI